MDKKKTTDIWKLYEQGVSFNRERNLYQETVENWQFYNGDQWQGLDSGDLEPIVLNILKPMVNYKVGVLNENNWSINYNTFIDKSVLDKKLYEEALKVLNEKARKTYEKNQLDTINGRRLGRAACVTSEGILYSFEDQEMPGEIKTRLIKNTDLLYGDENNDDIQEQPYLINVQRVDIDEAKEIARLLASEEIANAITPDEIGLDDKDSDYGQNEVNRKVTILTHFYKKKGMVYFCKTTRNIDITTNQPLKTDRYPFDKFIWDDVIDSARGTGVVKWQIANQLEINKTAMRIMMAIRLSAYPRMIYAKGSVANVGALNDIGAAIEVDDKGLVGIRGLIDYINPASLSPDAREFQDYLMNKTQELESSGDAATGNIDPEKASGRAILSAQRAARAPLNEQKERYKAFLENVGKTWLSIWKATALEGLEVTIKETEGLEEVERKAKITPEILKKIEADVNIDASPKSAYDKITSDMTMIDMYTGGQISLDELTMVLDSDSSIPKAKLEKIVETRKIKDKAIAAIEKRMNELESNTEIVMEGANIQNQQTATSQINPQQMMAEAQPQQQ